MPDAYALWVVLEITNSLGGPLKVQNARLSWGMFYKNGDKQREIPPEEVDKIVIPAGSEGSVSSCGRLDSPSGTEGTIDLYDDTTKVCTLYWDCPWVSPHNNFAVRDVNQGYNVTNGPWNAGTGPLGNITIKVALKE
ncbi:Aegerolysin family protein [Leucogyrophana mollusca]|uniref:Aegerolysin family protein n=1 Tax=Leucogyrophana mollusca TaxID=85980 RepID=A0ACB8B0J7_9AGAM|nr:Aegerolysin family protein [Leucogyrophana mollusca]